MAELSHSVILGGEEFIAEIETRFLRDKQLDRDLPTLRDLSSRPGLGQIEKQLIQYCNQTKNWHGRSSYICVTGTAE